MAEETTTITPVSDAEIAGLFSIGDSTETTSVKPAVANPLKRDNIEIDLDINHEEDLDDDLPPAPTGPTATTTDDVVIELGDTVKPDKVEKVSNYKALNDLVKSGSVLLFEGDKKLEEYSDKEIAEVLQANFDRVREEEAAKAPGEFFDSLSEELQYAANYTANGGTDLKSLFKKLAAVEEVKSYDITKESGQEKLIQAYFEATNYGTDEEILEEVNSLKDTPGALEKKAKQFQPKLESIHQQEVDRQLKQQEAIKANDDKNELAYQEAVYNTVSAGQLGDLKIAKSVQGLIYNSMVPAMKPLGDLLKATGTKSNVEHLSKVMWYLKDPKGFEDALKAIGSTEKALDTVKKLKTAESARATNADTETVSTTKRTLPVKKANFFTR